MGLRRTVDIFASLSHPLVALGAWFGSSTWIIDWLCIVPGYGLNQLTFSQKPPITYFTFICTDIYLHLSVLCPSFADPQITNFVSKRTAFFCRYPLCQRVNTFFSLHLHNSILTPGNTDNACAAIQVCVN